MSFSVRVHPAPFSPTPNRHAGIGLKMKSVGPGGSRLNLSVFSIPREKSTRGAGPQKEVDVLAHIPPRRWRWQWRCGWLAGEVGMWRSLKERSDELSQGPPFHPHPPYFFLLYFLASFSFHFFLCALDQLPHPSSVSLIWSASLCSASGSVAVFVTSMLGCSSSVSRL